ncbi:B3/B4 domain-containing protein (DNA/RNA-binding domain of Phe-tRNA-synthetase) [Nonomuraea solani]|uniref:B3/B4 domain-containing protein (DNA/RNA-binding domain of Phe-tRNA-synthetase) n=1 Tax=Nonomuraea solani TaxID=1144553 RepID=A0A1H6DJ59_9ACTN|nr:phenylalanine--tRNA ligase beta subunit-related protein [Nonomuraea solani]SEG85211.1 B3/B4 domain-containing protein (DNA/RNA-binding domain of Phe-tRNA-synthetase) [Nonomuraea solani]
MHFQHAEDIWRDFPELVPGVLYAEGITGDVSATAQIARYNDLATARLATVSSESELPEIQAWRRAFSKMGLKPTQYRCASESLLRRFRKEGSLPSLHPLIDLCNAISIAYATPVAVFDVSRIAHSIEVRYAAGDETYLTFSGETEQPPAHEVIFADAEKRAHARRWSNRQSGLSAVRDTTTNVLIVAEALHDTAAKDMESLTAALSGELNTLWPVTPKTTILSPSAPRFTFTGE